MIVFISIETILVIALILGSPIIALGIKISEVLDIIAGYAVEIAIASFILAIIIALIFAVVTKDWLSALPIALNTPAIGIFSAFAIAELARGFGVIYGIISIILSFFGWMATVIVTFGVFIAIGNSAEKIEKTKQKISYSSFIAKNILYCLLGVLLQFGIFAFCFF